MSSKGADAMEEIDEDLEEEKNEPEISKTKSKKSLDKSKKASAEPKKTVSTEKLLKSEKPSKIKEPKSEEKTEKPDTDMAIEPTSDAATHSGGLVSHLLAKYGGSALASKGTPLKSTTETALQSTDTPKMPAVQESATKSEKLPADSVNKTTNISIETPKTKKPKSEPQSAYPRSSFSEDTEKKSLGNKEKDEEEAFELQEEVIPEEAADDNSPLSDKDSKGQIDASKNKEAKEDSEDKDSKEQKSDERDTDQEKEDDKPEDMEVEPEKIDDATKSANADKKTEDAAAHKELGGVSLAIRKKAGIKFSKFLFFRFKVPLIEAQNLAAILEKITLDTFGTIEEEYKKACKGFLRLIKVRFINRNL